MNIEKLPKWAQEHIEDLKRKIAERETTIRELRVVGTRDTTTGIVVDPHGEHPLVYPSDRTVRMWIIPDEFAIDLNMRGQMYGPRRAALTVMGYGLRSTGMIVVTPVAGNVVAICEGER